MNEDQPQDVDHQGPGPREPAPGGDGVMKTRWQRGGFMLLFLVCVELSLSLAALISLVQFLFHLIDGKPNANLRHFGRALSAYISELLAYLFYHGERRPFPFSPWPGIDD